MEKVSNVISNALNNFSNIMEQNTRGTQIGCYSVAFVGLTIALRKVRPFSKFKQPNDIPNHFIQEKRELTGLVKRIEPNGALLMIQHQPLINIPVIPSGQLPVKISGVNVSGFGLNWLQTVVAKNEVKFIPVAKTKDYVQCQVILVCKNKENKQEIINVGEKLVRIGFGIPESPVKSLSENSDYLSYFHRLQAAEKYALRKKLGFKYYLAPTRKILLILYARLTSLLLLSLNKLKKVSKQTPKLYIS